jgi:hypothetical protein
VVALRVVEEADALGKRRLDQLVRRAREFSQLSDAERRTLLDRVAPRADLRLEPYKLGDY